MFSQIIKRSIVNKVQQFLKFHIFSMSTLKQKNTRVSEVGFKTQNIINTNKLTFILQQPIEFVNGKALLYQSKKGFMVTLRRYFSYSLSISSIGMLIYFNPFKYVFPAAIPILWILEIILIKLMFKRLQWNQEILHQIYLLESGSTTQIHYADKIRRRLFGQPQSTTYYNTIFADPIERQKEQIMPNSHPFPQKIIQFEKPAYGWFWCKYFSNGDNYLIIPKNNNLIRKDVLVQLFKGKTIKNP